ncbi:MAG TPA: sugar ABC transporter permease [Acidimicrobiia bacterium]|nr:sugar ABC transporter permease [Acidimicrobiia bacterium]
MMVAATEAPKGRVKLGKTERANLRLGLLFISPWIIGFLAFLAYPLYYTLRISFTRFSGFGEATWIGLANYERMLTDNLFWKSLGNTLYYTTLAVPIGVVVAMVLALAMNQRLREVSIYRGALFLPSILPLFAVSFIFIALMDPIRGIFNQFLGVFGIPSINWFSDPRYAKLALVLLAQLGAGQIALIFLAGLKGIPATLYEAAEIDGAGAWTKFWNITLPLMTPIILYDIILGLSLGLQAFTQAYVIGAGPAGSVGNPANSTLFYVLYLYLNAFRYSQMGYAAALGWILFIVTFLLALLVFRWARRWVHYETV